MCVLFYLMVQKLYMMECDSYFEAISIEGACVKRVELIKIFENIKKFLINLLLKSINSMVNFPKILFLCTQKKRGIFIFIKVTHTVTPSMRFIFKLMYKIQSYFCDTREQKL